MPGEVEFLDGDGQAAVPGRGDGIDVVDHGPGATSTRLRLLAWGLAVAVVLAGGAAWLGGRDDPSGAASAVTVPATTAARSVVPAVPTTTVVIDPRNGALVWPNTIPAPTAPADQVQAERARSVSCVAHYLRRLVGMAEAYRNARAHGKVHTAAERAAAARLAEHVRKGSKRYYAVWRAWAQNRAPLVEHSGPVVMTEQCG